MANNQTWRPKDYIRYVLDDPIELRTAAIESGTDPTLFRCGYCDWKSKDFKEFRIHIRDQHCGARYCHECDDSFYRLGKHIKYNHQIKCPVGDCNLEFETKLHLERHVL